MYERLEFLRTLHPDILEDFPRLIDFMSRIAALPTIKKYMESDKLIKSPFLNKAIPHINSDIYNFLRYRLCGYKSESYS